MKIFYYLYRPSCVDRIMKCRSHLLRYSYYLDREDKECILNFDGDTSRKIDMEE
jgi:hypothetical protein